MGDRTEKDLFKHYEHSESMENFVLMLGTKINLSTHTGYFGGLRQLGKEIEENQDNSRDKGGRYSLYTEHENKGVMFHVSTLLPTVVDGTDDQQIQVIFLRFILEVHMYTNIKSEQKIKRTISLTLTFTEEKANRKRYGVYSISRWGYTFYT